MREKSKYKFMKLLFALMSVMVAVVATGCGKRNTQVYRSAIEQYLNDKYCEEFSIEDVYFSMDGNNGHIVYARCKSERFSDIFLVKCYRNKEITDDVIMIDGKEYCVEDTYATVIFRDGFMKEIGAKDSDNCVLRSEISFLSEKYPSAESISQGISYCLGNQELKGHIRLYIISEGSEEAEKYKEKAMEFYSEYKPYKADIFYVVKTDFDADEAASIYSNTADFKYFVLNDEYPDKVEHITYYSESDSFKTKQIKG